MWERFSIATQELYEKSLVRVEDGSLSAELLEIKSFLSVPQVTPHKPHIRPAVTATVTSTLLHA